MDPRVNYCAPFFIAALFIFIVALFTYRRRRVRGGWYLTLACLAAAVWAATEGILYLGLDLEANLFITYMQYLGIASLPPLALLFVLSVFGFDAWITRFRITLLFIIAATIIVLVWTNSLHHLFFVDYYKIDTGPFPMIGLEHGALWWIFIGYQYFLVAVLSIVLIRQVLTSSGVHSSQAGVMLVAVGIVWIVNAVYISGNSPVLNMDISPLAFTLVAVSMSWGFFRYNLLDIMPIAKTEIFSGLIDPILVLDQKNRIMHLSALSDRRGVNLGRVIVMHDTTEQKRTAEALRENEKLQGAFEMAGAVCHELNQPLMAISGYSELIAMKVKKDDPLYTDIVKIVKQVERMGRITQKLMFITRYETKEYLDRKIIDIEKSSPTAKTDS